MRHEVKGRVWRTSRGSWAGHVTVNGVVVHVDGTGSWSVVYEDMREMADAFEKVANAGCGSKPSPVALRRAIKVRR